jgi:hypothetical protein
LTIAIGVRMIKAICSADRDFHSDDSVWIYCDPENVHVFDKENGAAILND